MSTVAEVYRGVRRPSRVVMVALLTGGAFLVSGPERTSADAFITINHTGGYLAWGWFYLLLAGAVVLGMTLAGRVLLPALFVAAASYGVLTVCFVISAFQSSTASILGVVWCGWLCWIHVDTMLSERWLE